MLGKTTDGNGAKAREPAVFAVRVLTAALQATAIYLLTDAEVPPLSWPATEPRLFEPLLLVSIYVPLIVLLGLGQIGFRPLAVWTALAAALVAGLGYHDAARGWVAGFPLMDQFAGWARLYFALSVGLFIAQVLVVDSIIEHRLMPSYARHFDTAWKQGVQGVLAAIFVGVFWGVLHLGAGLFKLVDIDFFQRLILHRWFAYPATTVAVAVAIHVTDVQPSLIRGVRSLALTLLSWLLPLLAAILFGFLCSLPFISLAPLWKTHFATTLLLIASALLVFLINSFYQDGNFDQDGAERSPSRVKRLAGTVGALELLPLVGLSAWALSLRVEQYGWTLQRISAAAVIVVAACYAVGYVSAAVRAPIWLKRLEITNFVTAYVTLAVILGLFSPIADPARLMVASQVARLTSGAIRPEKFDFVALKFDGARWGAAALAELSRIKDGPDADAIASRAAEALATVNRYGINQPDVTLLTAAQLADRVTVYPPGRNLPASFYDMKLGPLARALVPTCFRLMNSAKCTARFLSLHLGEPEAILFLDASAGYFLEQDAAGQWQKTAQLTTGFHCDHVRQDLESGDFTLEAHAWPDLVVSGQRLEITPPLPHPCNTAPAGAVPPKTTPQP